MSQAGLAGASGGGSLTETLTGNTGGAVPPTGNNINVVGDGTTITVAGNPGTSTLTISAVNTGVLETLTGNSGGAIAPVAGNINTVGTGSITIAGAGSTLTTQLTGLTNHNVLVGAGTATITNVSPSTSGFVLTSNGVGSDPSFQAVSASGAITTITGNSGGAEVPSSGNFNILGSGSITTAGTANTETISLTGLTNHNLLVGAGTATITKVAPSATSGVPVISQGASADPTFGTAVVAGGGTGSTSFNTTGVVISGATSTTALAAVTLADGQLAIGSSIGNPAAATLTAGTGISVTNGHNSITIAASGTQTLTVTSVNHAASPYTVLSTDQFLAVDCSGGVVSILLPNSPSTGRTYIIKDSKGNAATSNITVTTVGGVVTIDGATSYAMNVNYEAINVIFDGTTYEVF